MGSLYFIAKLILTLSLQVSSMQRQLTKIVSFSKSHDSFMIHCQQILTRNMEQSA